LLATGEVEKFLSKRDGLKLSVSVLEVSERSTAGLSGRGVPEGEAFEIVGVSFPGPPYLFAGADPFTDELNESDLGAASLSGKKAGTNCRDSGGAGGSPARGDS